MSNMKKFIITLLLTMPLFSFTQTVSNVHFEQEGKQIHIYYDLEGGGNYFIKVYCNTGNETNWGNPLQFVSGAVGENQKAGKGKKIVWDVLKERDKLTGEIKFKIEVSNIGTFIDKRDGHRYRWVKIGSQIWMEENLAYLPTVSPPDQGSYYDRYYYVIGYVGKNIAAAKATENYQTYGVLYNWKSALTACPHGWHLPSDKEWQMLEIHLGISERKADAPGLRGTDEGEKMKSTSGWYNNGNGTNSSGFNALPGGYRGSNGSFSSLGRTGRWWSSAEISGSNAWDRNLFFGYHQVSRNGYDKSVGFSVRCIKN